MIRRAPFGLVGRTGACEKAPGAPVLPPPSVDLSKVAQHQKHRNKARMNANITPSFASEMQVLHAEADCPPLHSLICLVINGFMSTTCAGAFVFICEWAHILLNLDAWSSDHGKE
jgi:hypothetical protein